MTKFGKMVLSTAVLLLLLVLCSGFAYADGVKVGKTTGDSLNLREAPKTTAKVITQLDKGTQVSIIETTDGWYKVNSGNLTGWVSSEFVTTAVAAIGKGTISGDNVNVRSGPSKASDVVTRLNDGDSVSVLAVNSGWYSIKTSDGTSGWVNKDFIFIKSSNSSRGDEARPATEDSNSTGEKVVEYAKKFIGVKYVYGGTSPSGFDCSGFTQYVLAHFGINIERTAADQAKQGEHVKKADLRAGDLVFFDTDGGHNYINHAGMYIGDGNFIEASSGSSTHHVIITSINSSFYSNAYMTARRFLK